MHGLFSMFVSLRVGIEKGLLAGVMARKHGFELDDAV